MANIFDGLKAPPKNLFDPTEPVAPVQSPTTTSPGEIIEGAYGNEFTKGFRRGVLGLAGTGVAAVSQVVEPFDKQIADSYFQKASEILDFDAELRPKVEKFDDVKDVGSFVDYGLSKMGEGAPSTGASLLAAGVGGGAGLGLRALGARVSPAALGTVAGAGSMLPPELGESAMTLRDDPVAMANTTPTQRLGISAAKGTVNAMLEFLPERVALGRAFGKTAGKGGFGEIAKSTAIGAGEAALGEAATEGAQQFTGQVAHSVANPQRASDGDFADIKEAAIGGAFGGVGLGAVAGGVQGIRSNIDAGKEVTVDAAQGLADKYLKGKVSPEKIATFIREFAQNPEQAAAQTEAGVAAVGEAVVAGAKKIGEVAVAAGDKAQDVLAEVNKTVKDALIKSESLDKPGETVNRKWLYDIQNNVGELSADAYLTLRDFVADPTNVHAREKLGYYAKGMVVDTIPKATQRSVDWVSRFTSSYGKSVDQSIKKSLEWTDSKQRQLDTLLKSDEYGPHLRGMKEEDRRVVMTALLATRESPKLFENNPKALRELNTALGSKPKDVFTYLDQEQAKYAERKKAVDSIIEKSVGRLKPDEAKRMLRELQSLSDEELAVRAGESLTPTQIEDENADGADQTGEQLTEGAEEALTKDLDIKVGHDVLSRSLQNLYWLGRGSPDTQPHFNMKLRPDTDDDGKPLLTPQQILESFEAPDYGPRDQPKTRKFTAEEIKRYTNDDGSVSVPVSAYALSSELSKPEYHDTLPDYRPGQSGSSESRKGDILMTALSTIMNSGVDYETTNEKGEKVKHKLSVELDELPDSLRIGKNVGKNSGKTPYTLHTYKNEKPVWAPKSAESLEIEREVAATYDDLAKSASSFEWFDTFKKDFAAVSEGRNAIMGPSASASVALRTAKKEGLNKKEIAKLETAAKKALKALKPEDRKRFEQLDRRWKVMRAMRGARYGMMQEEYKRITDEEYPGSEAADKEAEARAWDYATKNVSRKTLDNNRRAMVFDGLKTVIDDATSIVLDRLEGNPGNVDLIDSLEKYFVSNGEDADPSVISLFDENKIRLFGKDVLTDKALVKEDKKGIKRTPQEWALNQLAFLRQRAKENAVGGLFAEAEIADMLDTGANQRPNATEVDGIGNATWGRTDFAASMPMTTPEDRQGLLNQFVHERRLMSQYGNFRATYPQRVQRNGKWITTDHKFGFFPTKEAAQQFIDSLPSDGFAGLRIKVAGHPELFTADEAQTRWSKTGDDLRLNASIINPDTGEVMHNAGITASNMSPGYAAALLKDSAKRMPDVAQMKPRDGRPWITREDGKRELLTYSELEKTLKAHEKKYDEPAPKETILGRSDEMEVNETFPGFEVTDEDRLREQPKSTRGAEPDQGPAPKQDSIAGIESKKEYLDGIKPQPEEVAPEKRPRSTLERWKTPDSTDGSSKLKSVVSRIREEAKIRSDDDLKRKETPKFTIEETKQTTYQQRTYLNANETDATWAVAADFNSTGERLTARVAGDKLVQTNLSLGVKEAAAKLLAHLQEKKARTLNIAGNGIATIARMERFRGISPEVLQKRYDDYVRKVLEIVVKDHPLEGIRSGGQTGADESGAKAGIALGIPTKILMPRDHLILTPEGSKKMTREEAMARFAVEPTAKDPRKIVGAVVRLGGKEYEATNHFLGMQKAQAEGYTKDKKQPGDAINLFRLSDGSLVTAEEAEKIGGGKRSEDMDGVFGAVARRVVAERKVAREAEDKAKDPKEVERLAKIEEKKQKLLDEQAAFDALPDEEKQRTRNEGKSVVKAKREAAKVKAKEKPHVDAATFTSDARKTFVNLIKKRGGIEMKEARDISGERGFHANSGFGAGVFRKDGRPLDDHVEWMSEQGYINQSDIDGDVAGALEKARELIRDALNGDPVFTPEQMVEYESLRQEEQAQDDAARKATPKEERVLTDSDVDYRERIEPDFSEQVNEEIEAENRQNDPTGRLNVSDTDKKVKEAAAAVKGENIASPFKGRNTSPLAAALTNVTYGKYPVDNVEGLTKPDPSNPHKMSAEAWYQANKVPNLDKSMKVMRRIIVAKLRQYPELVKQINAKGGAAWIANSNHTVNGNPRWEGKGLESNFLKVLHSAFNIVNGTSEQKPEAKPSRGKVEVVDRYTREEIRANPNKVYVFGDNIVGRGLGGQAAAARGEPNAIGIPTKYKPTTDESAYFGKNVEKEKAAITAAVDKLIEAQKKGKTVVVPRDGVGSGRAQLKERAPEVWAHLREQMQRLKSESPDHLGPDKLTDTGRDSSEQGPEDMRVSVDDKPPQSRVEKLNEPRETPPTGAGSRASPHFVPMTYVAERSQLRKGLQDKYPQGTSMVKLIKDGNRTATTRAPQAGVRVGDYIRFSGVMEHYRVTGFDRVDLSTPEGVKAWEAKEGWDAKAVQALYPNQVKTGAIQMTFERAGNEPDTDVKAQTKSTPDTPENNDDGKKPKNGGVPPEVPEKLKALIQKMFGKKVQIIIGAPDDKPRPNEKAWYVGRRQLDEYKANVKKLQEVRDARRGALREGKLKEAIMHQKQEERLLAQTQVLGLIHLSPSLSEAEQLSGLYHESVHAAFDILLTPEERAVLGTAFTKGMARNKLKEIFKDDPAVSAQLENPEEAAAYAFEIYAVSPEKLQLGKEVSNIFLRVQAFFRKLLGILTPEEKAWIIMDSMLNGTRNEQEISPLQKVLAKDQTFAQRSQRFAKEMGNIIEKGWDIIATNSYERMQKTDIPSLQKIADLGYSKTGQDGALGMVHKWFRSQGEWLNKLDKLMKGFDVADIKKAAEAKIKGETPTDTRVKAAFDAMTGYFDEMHKYSFAAGTGLAYEKGYYPLVWDPETVYKDQAKFLIMIKQEKYKDEMDRLMITPMELWKNIAGYTTRGDQFQPVVAHGEPVNEYSRERSLRFIQPEDRLPFMQDDPIHTLLHYTKQTVRQAEYVRAYGKNGAILGDLLKEAKDKYGATPEQLVMAKDYVDGLLGNKEVGMSREVKDVFGTMTVYQNFRLLPFSLFSSLVDPLGIAVRSNSIKDAGETFLYSMKNIFRDLKSNRKDAGKDYWEKIAEDWGMIEDAQVLSNIHHMYESVELRGFSKRMNEALFKYNLLNGWTRSTKIMAIKAAQRFMDRAADGEFGKDSERYLEELGLKKSDIVKMPNKRIALKKEELMAQGVSEDQAVEIENRLKDATTKFVNQAVLNPTAADLPGWGSNPYFAPIFHLKQFMFTFQSTILSRITQEAEQGNYKPLLAASAYIPGMIAADMIRGFVSNMGEQPPWQENWEVSDYVLNGVERSGLLGVGAIVTSMKDDMMHGGAGYESLAGPSVDQLKKGVRAVQGGDQAIWNFMVKAMPLNPIYDQWALASQKD